MTRREYEAFWCARSTEESREKKLEEIQKQIVMVWIRKKQLWKWLEKLSRERTTIVRVGQVIKVFRRRFLCCTHHHHRCCYFWWGLVTWAVRRRPSRSLFHQVLHIILLSLSDSLLRVLWTCWKPIRFCHTLSLCWAASSTPAAAAPRVTDKVKEAKGKRCYIDTNSSNSD